jgi:signal transduction histidine kinase
LAQGDPRLGEGAYVNQFSGTDAASANHQAHPQAAPTDQPSTDTAWSEGVRLEAVANLAHELRTPIQVLLGYLDILREDFGNQFTAEPRDLLDRMNTNVHDLAQTIENIMHFVLAEANAEAAIDEEVTIRGLLTDITPTLDAANFKKRLRLSYDFSRAPEAIRVPRRPLRSILLNLALNAIKFTEAGSVAIKVRRAPGESQGAQEQDAQVGDAIEIEVSDTGPGISPARFEQAARPFAQLSNTSARRYRGLGLGLAVVQRSLDLLSASMELRSNSGRGSTFIVTLPIREVSMQTGARKPNLKRKSAMLSPTPSSAPPHKPASGGIL